MPLSAGAAQVLLDRQLLEPSEVTLLQSKLWLTRNAVNDPLTGVTTGTVRYLGQLGCVPRARPRLTW